MAVANAGDGTQDGGNSALHFVSGSFGTISAVLGRRAMRLGIGP